MVRELKRRRVIKRRDNGNANSDMQNSGSVHGTREGRLQGIIHTITKSYWNANDTSRRQQTLETIKKGGGITQLSFADELGDQIWQGSISVRIKPLELQTRNTLCHFLCVRPDFVLNRPVHIYINKYFKTWLQQDRMSYAPMDKPLSARNTSFKHLSKYYL